jgi:hypothetical protein
MKTLLWLLRIGWEYQSDTNRFTGLISEKWWHRRTGEVRFANHRH